jgi:hypothetical protein
VRSYSALFLTPRAHIPHTPPALPPSIPLPAPGPLRKPVACTPQPRCSPSETLLVRRIIPRPLRVNVPSASGVRKAPSRIPTQLRSIPAPVRVHTQISYNEALETLDFTKLALIGATIAQVSRCFLSTSSALPRPPVRSPPPLPPLPPPQPPPPPPASIYPLYLLAPKHPRPASLVCPVHGPRRSLAHRWTMVSKMQSPAASADHPLMHCFHRTAATTRGRCTAIYRCAPSVRACAAEPQSHAASPPGHRRAPVPRA